MKLTREQRDLVFNQINDFNNQSLNDLSSETLNTSLTPKTKLTKGLFYVPEDEAQLASAFFKNVHTLNVPPSGLKVIDLCFGSGNLTSHIVLDNDFELEKIVYNDKNLKFANENIQCEKIKTVQSKDVLIEVLDDGNKYDLIVFNPQIGGGYDKGDFDPQFKAIGLKESGLAVLRDNIESIAAKNHTLVFYGKKTSFQEYIVGYNDVKVLLTGKQNDIFIAQKGGEEPCWTCYKKDGNSFVVTDCEQSNSNTVVSEQNLEDISLDIDGCLQNIMETVHENPLSLGIGSDESGTKEMPAEVETSGYCYTDKALGNTDFPIKNLLLKGVPGTGKSHLIEQVIAQKLEIDANAYESHVLRINIHSGSSNADLMQGIGLTTNGVNIEYKEKQGLIFDFICRACAAPNQPFVLVLEEIQENSLNELIGDLIYLIEPEKRANTKSSVIDAKNLSGQKLMEAYINASDGKMKYVRIPNLVSAGTEYRKMILPENLYIFCTSNYRDDKKIIEDNLLRRFDALDVFPDQMLIEDTDVRKFFAALNSAILDVLSDEVHPDRFEIGHAAWMEVQLDVEESFARALYKSIIELKEIREIQSSDLIKILGKVKGEITDENVISEVLSNFNNNLIDFIKDIQQKAYPDLLGLLSVPKQDVEDQK